MAHPQNVSTLQKFLQTQIRPSDRLHITINMQQEPADEPWFPGMSVFSVNEPPHSVTQIGVQQEQSPSNFSMPTSLPLRPRPGSGRIPFTCSYPACLDSFDTELTRNTHEANIHGAILSTLKVHGKNSSEEISPAVVIQYMRQSGASEDAIRGAYSSPVLLDYNCQLMLLEQQNRKRLAMGTPQPAVQEFLPPSHSGTSAYHTQLGLLEEQNQKRLAMARTPLPAFSDNFPPANQGGPALQDYNFQLMLLEQQNKKRLAMAREEQDKHPQSQAGFRPKLDEQKSKREMSSELSSAYEMPQKQHNAIGEMQHQKKPEPKTPLTLPSLPSLDMPVHSNGHSSCHNTSINTSDDQSSKLYTGPSHQLWLSGPHALQNYATQRRLIEQQKTPQNPAPRNVALQDYQMQLMLLEQQNKKRKMLQDAAKARENNEQAHKHRKSHGESQPIEVQTAAGHSKSDLPALKGGYEVLAQLEKYKEQMQHSPPAAPGTQKNASAEQIAVQRQAMIQRHQANLIYWQSTQQRKQQEATNKALQEAKPSTPVHSSHYPLSQPTQPKTRAAREHQPANITTSGLASPRPHDLPDYEVLPLPSFTGKPTAAPDSYRHNDQPMQSGITGGQFTMNLPIRPSKKAVEQTDPEMDGWSDVERPRERACSEESEQFFEGSDAADLIL